MKSCPDLNAAGVGVEGKIIKNVEFHPWSQVALVSGGADTVSLYQVSKYVTADELLNVTQQVFNKKSNSRGSNLDENIR